MKIFRNGFLIILFVLFIFPYTVFATNCKVVAGSGHDLGDEIACGDEHFYLLSNENNELELFAKYNLYAGVEIHKVKMETTTGNATTDYNYCDEVARSNGGSIKSDDFYNVPGYCFYAKLIQTDRIYQSEDAKSAHWDEDLNYLYPQVGDVYVSSATFDYNSATRLQSDSDFYDTAVNINSNESNSYPSTKPAITINTLRQYKEQFVLDGYQVNSIDLLRLGRLDDIINQTANKRLPLKQWGTNVNVTLQDSSNLALEAHFGDLKPYILDKYKWLYSTTYWNSTYFSYSAAYSNRLFVFVAEQGKLCGAGFAYCAPTTTLGCGLRPVLMMPSSQLEYGIFIPENPNGTVEVVDSSLPGQPITFKVSAKEGYKLDKIIVKTESGQEITFTEDEIIKNEDGTISITNNRFTMPSESVTIEAKWISIYNNPETWSSIIIILLIVGFVIVSSISMARKQQKKSK